MKRALTSSGCRCNRCFVFCFVIGSVVLHVIPMTASAGSQSCSDPEETAIVSQLGSLGDGLVEAYNKSRKPGAEYNARATADHARLEMETKFTTEVPNFFAKIEDFAVVASKRNHAGAPCAKTQHEIYGTKSTLVAYKSALRNLRLAITEARLDDPYGDCSNPQQKASQTCIERAAKTKRDIPDLVEDALEIERHLQTDIAAQEALFDKVPQGEAKTHGEAKLSGLRGPNAAATSTEVPNGQTDIETVRRQIVESLDGIPSNETDCRRH